MEYINDLINIIPAIFATVFGGFITLRLAKMTTQLADVHMLVNSNFGAQLKLNAANSRWRADMSKKKEDIKAAAEAEKLLREHEATQTTVNAHNVTPTKESL